MRKGGFTIVELLIVIVVIAILAAITITVFRGIQTRANATRTVSDIQAVNKAVQMYYADTGSYPSTGGGWYGYQGVQTANYVPGVAPTYISSLPPMAKLSTQTEYIYRSDGTNYKLIVHDDGGPSGTGAAVACPAVQSSNPSMIDPQRGCWAYGFWTAGATAW